MAVFSVTPARIELLDMLSLRPLPYVRTAVVIVWSPLLGSLMVR